MTELEVILLATVGSAIPVVLWLVFFYTRDRYQREPKWLIAVLFFVGAVPVAIIAELVNVSVQAFAGVVLTVILVAPIGEEILKYLGMRFPVRRHRAFNEPIDGMVYGSTVGLGFAFTENIDYLFAGYLGIPVMDDLPLCDGGLDCFLELAFLRGTGTALMHALATGIAGFYLAKHVLADRPRTVELRGVGIAALIHIAWNLGLQFPALAGAAAPYAILARRALAASPHRLKELDDAHHWIEHFAVGDGLLQPCPRCQHLHHPGQRFCSVCGLRLLDPRARHSRPCPACDQPQPATGRYCSACREHLGAAKDGKDIDFVRPDPGERQ
ncbi:MAG: PrsW family intramembrane metalloprotease [Ectothiorhodospiraceae bacterium]|nr:PrsW family intramembrane metalloprotease [Ectothiorhodospiraceae bacterium]